MIFCLGVLKDVVMEGREKGMEGKKRGRWKKLGRQENKERRRKYVAGRNCTLPGKRD